MKPIAAHFARVFILLCFVTARGFSQDVDQETGELKGPLNSIAENRYKIDSGKFEGRPEITRGVTEYEKSFPDRSLTSFKAGSLAIVGGIVVQKAPQSIDTTPLVLEEFAFQIDQSKGKVNLEFSIEGSQGKLQADASLIPLATKFVIDQRPVLITLAANYPIRENYESDPTYTVAKYQYQKRSILERFAVNPAIADHSLVVDATRLEFALGSLTPIAPKGTTHFVLMGKPWVLDSNPWRSELTQFNVLSRGSNAATRSESDLTQRWEDQLSVEESQSLYRLRKFSACQRFIYCLLTEHALGVSSTEFSNLLDACEPFYKADVAEFRESTAVAQMFKENTGRIAIPDGQ